jgi:hypothetical protein
MWMLTMLAAAAPSASRRSQSRCCASRQQMTPSHQRRLYPTRPSNKTPTAPSWSHPVGATWGGLLGEVRPCYGITNLGFCIELILGFAWDTSGRDVTKVHVRQNGLIICNRRGSANWLSCCLYSSRPHYTAVGPHQPIPVEVGVSLSTVAMVFVCVCRCAFQ